MSRDRVKLLRVRMPIRALPRKAINRERIER